MKLEDRKMLVPIALDILKYANKILPEGMNQYHISKIKLQYEVQSPKYPKPTAAFEIDLLDVLNYEYSHPLLEEEQTQSSELNSNLNNESL